MGVDDKTELTVKDQGYLRGAYNRSVATSGMAVSKPHQLAKNLETLVLNVEKSGDAHAIGQQGRQNTANSKSQAEEKKKERELNRLIMQTIRQNIEAARHTLNDLDNLIDLKLEQATTGQTLKQIEFEEINESLKAIHKGIERLERGEALELDGNGKLKDPTLESVIKQWEEKTGKIVDRENPAFLMLVFKKAQPEYERRQEWLKEYLDIYKEEIGFCKNSKGTLKQLKDEGKNIENKSPEEQKAWTEKVNKYKKDTLEEGNRIDAKKSTLDEKLKTGIEAKPAQNVTSDNISKIPASLKLDF